MKTCFDCKLTPICNVQKKACNVDVVAIAKSPETTEVLSAISAALAKHCRFYQQEEKTNCKDYFAASEDKKNV